MNKTRKLEIDKMAENIVRKLTAENIGLIGVMLWSVVKDCGDKLSANEIREIREMADDPKDNDLPEPVKQFLSSISNNPDEVKYFVSKMQNNIVRELEENDRIAVEEIEKLRDFFTVKSLAECCLNKEKQAIRILITAVVFDEIIQFEEYRGISGRICDLITELPLESIVDMGDAMCEAYSIIYEYDF